MAEEPREDHIAIVGMACRLPGANNPGEYWENLVGGVESITMLSEEELEDAGVAPRTHRHPHYVNAAALIDDMEGFDARFFGYTPREAEIRDPQGRMFLEACHSAIEDSGYDVTRMPGQVGVFGGMANNFYGERNVARNAAAKSAVGNMAIEVSNSPDYLTTTVSYRLGLRGPSVNVQTACSTALVAVHLASQALRGGECDYALAGGVEVELPYATGYTWHEGGIYSRTGHIRPFDADASGTLFGTGVGVVALKRLGDALADGDHIYAVVRGSAVNNDGGDRAGFTAPGVQGQIQLVAEALAVAEVHPDTIGFVEAHATGTLVGDPIEVAGLTKAFRTAGATGTGTCPIGSVKANIGHLGPAAGAAGLIKICLALQHEAIPPNINFERPNPSLELDTSPFYVPTEVTPWKAGTRPRRAGVSSFGIGGTNAHVVIEEAPRPVVREPGKAVPSGRRTYTFPVSGRTADAAENAARLLGRHLDAHPDTRLADVARTLQSGRTAHRFRRVVAGGSVSEVASGLQSTRSSRQIKAPGAVIPRRPVLMFPGQGSQYAGMGRELYRTETVFREAIDTCAELLRPHLDLDLRELLYPEDLPADEAERRLRETRHSQPALFAVSYAQAMLLMSAGLEPRGMIGHSVGEYVAAHLAGVFTLDDVLAIVAARGRLMNEMPPGGMIAVAAPEQQTAALLPEGVEIASTNSRLSTVVAGPLEALDAVVAACESAGVAHTRLQTSHAFHSRMMEPCVEEFAATVARYRLHAPQLPFVSDVTGDWITDDQAQDPRYWAAHLRSPVRFADGLATLVDGETCLVEAGPSDTLSRLARQDVGFDAVPIVPTMRHPRRDAADDAVFAEALGSLWVNGLDIDWERWSGPGLRVSLPTYPFERQKFWVAPDPVRPGASAGADEHAGELPPEESAFAQVWREAPLLGAEPTVTAGHWLVFGSDHPVTGSLLAELTRAEGTKVTVVRAGDSFAETGPARFTVRPGVAEDLDALLTALADEAPPTDVVHAFTLTEPSGDPLSDAAVTDGLAHGFYDLLHLAQRLDRFQTPREGRDPGRIRLHVLSSNIQEVTGIETLEPAKSSLLGPVLVMERELTGVGARSVDLALPSEEAPEVLARRVLMEFGAPATDRQVAWRGRKRWLLDYRTVPLDATPATSPAIRPDGTYLITGGLGGLGLAVAEDLARKGPVTLLLAGRSALPPRERWRKLADDPETEPGQRRKLRSLLDIEELGATVHPLRCDVSDQAALAAALADVRGEHPGVGTVHGVFHSAGVAGGGMIAVRGDQDAQQVLGPKVAGTLALYRLLGDEADFMVLFSSVIAVSGMFGQVDYCGANTFMDRFACVASRAGRPVTSIGWTGWKDFGMAVETAAPEAFRRLEAGVRSEPARHPLLQRITRKGDDIEFATVLEPGEHWIHSEHRIGDTDVVVGAALVEMADGAYREAVGGTADITDVIFLGPVSVSGPTELRLVLTPDDAGHLVTVATAPAGGGARQWTQKMRCRMAPVLIEPAPRLDLAELSARCSKFSVAREYIDGAARLVHFGSRWEGSIKSIDVGDGEELSRIELPGEYRAETALFRLHPALLDSAVDAKYGAERIADGESYLPLGYGRIRVHEPLPAGFWAHFRRVSDDGAEVSSTDITLLGDDGRVLADITGYAERRIDPIQIRALTASPGGQDGPDQDDEAFGQDASTLGLAEFGITAEVGLDLLRRIVHWRPEPHLIVCPVGIHNTLRHADALNLETIRKQLGADGDGNTATATEDRLVDTDYVAPEPGLQRNLVDLWSSTLGVGSIGVDDDFFELGGNSLVAVQVMTRIRETLQQSVSMADLFENSTVRLLAELLRTAADDKAGAV
ncbi:type I polyketide synthase [Streptomyces sp. NBC_01716]|uniref:type I polyketide synthase n=1 Tax=Streptomyces sp. NBC_01716 TaxID=2975917 RepID=UPI002E32000F|nr:polyketide synthase [Streptomyces sp. NBC_01716]